MKRKKTWLLLAMLLAVSLLVWKIFASASAPASVISPSQLHTTSTAADVTDTGILQLVNRAHAVSGEPAQLVPAYPAVAVRETGILLRPEALEALRTMFAQAKAEGIEGLYLSSGYRSYGEQARVYAQAKDKSYAQPPGHSEHQTGLAADILALDISQERFGSSKQGRWLAQNAWRFGFILRYPEGKQGITGIAYEPWHFRYAGLPHARYCYENNLCLEEYLEK